MEDKTNPNGELHAPARRSWTAMGDDRTSAVYDESLRVVPYLQNQA
ncbi:MULTISPECIES: hypothetical protein [unclassified Caballeronia]|nr:MULTISPECIES: hypothetical protein [unclassified Caballeronia]MDR5774832.1 hypothetical protein [Caballeronia sp. LZ002]MDR5850268.1 hypothetical protein [Caballeronia sp. LZ003]